MTKSRFMLLLSLLGSVALVAGCSALAGTKCLKPPDAAATQDHAPLRIPLGLDAPDTRAALKIPALERSEAPPIATRCLEDPPQIVQLAAVVEDKKASGKSRRTQPSQRRSGPR